LNKSLLFKLNQKLKMVFKLLRNWSNFYAFINNDLIKKSNNKLRYIGAGTLVAATIAIYNTSDLNVYAAKRDLKTQQFMAEPITSLEHLIKYQNDMKTKMELMIMKIQTEFVKSLESFEDDNTKFKVDRWLRKEGGGGITCVLQDGTVFEKAGVNISVVTGTLPQNAVQQMRARGKHLDEGALPFFAAGISAVIHPRNPMVYYFMLI
jgi:coproporphyrinogen III oxidase